MLKSNVALLAVWPSCLDLVEVVHNAVMSAETSHSEVPMRNKVYAFPTWFFKNELCY